MNDINKKKLLNLVEVPLSEWNPKPDEIIVTDDGKLFVCRFDKALKNPELEKYNKFLIGKSSYENQLKTITSYINYFINFYDKDNELVTAYLKLKFVIDNDSYSEVKTFTKDNIESLIEFIYEIIFTKSMITKINNIVYDNYKEDIEAPSDKRTKYLKNDKKHLESLEFTNIHMKILFRISFGMKIICPIMFHFLSINSIKLERDSDVIYRFYQRLFDIFNTTETFDHLTNSGEMIRTNISFGEFHKIKLDKHLVEDDPTSVHPKYYDTDGTYYTPGTCNLYNKLYIYVKAKVMESNSNNASMFEQREIFGLDISSIINFFTKVVLISDNMVKYKFNENIVGFNKTIVKYQLFFFCKEQYEKNLNEVTNVKNSEGLSGVDKLLMNATKLDEGITIMADINIELTLRKIQNERGFFISDDEIEYYKKNMVPSKIQKQLVYSYYAKEFGSFNDLNLLTRTDYIKLVLILKRELLNNLGYDEDEDGVLRPAALPYILTGNLTSNINTRVIRNNKFISKIEDSYIYNNLIQKKYNVIEKTKSDMVLSILSTLINSRFTYVAYEFPELLGKEIDYSADKISDEILVFLNNI